MIRRVVITTLMVCSSYLHASSLQILNVNVGAGGRAVNYNQQCMHNDFGKDTDYAVIGMRRYLGKNALSAHRQGFKKQVVLLQEVDVLTRRNGRWDMPSYFTNKLNEYMRGNGVGNWLWSKHFSGVHYSGGKFGLATLVSGEAREKFTRRFKSTADGYNKMYQMTKVKVGAQWFWIINTHFTARDPLVAQKQLEELLADVKQLDQTANIIIAGDFNIYRDGLHRKTCPVKEACKKQSQAYNAMVKALDEHGFEEIGAFDGPCWKKGKCTFKASGGNYARIDYAYILKRNKNMRTSLMLDRPYVDPYCLLTDHFAMKINLSW